MKWLFEMNILQNAFYHSNQTMQILRLEEEYNYTSIFAVLKQFGESLTPTTNHNCDFPNDGYFVTFIVFNVIETGRSLNLIMKVTTTVINE